ncbi:NAD(P)-binding protein [Mucilaginibacter sp. NFX135]|uniref:NAD(P)-binding protein n=1 Tax=Mucilaginibacter sp. NFX135 TaxID=3402687 RepID=UPI003AFAAF3D
MPNQATDTAQAEEYLKQFTVDRNQYIIGIYQKGITIHNQQIRALNIFHCLYLLGKINKDTRVGIIGGGIAGLTFAAAALHSRIKVSLFEKDEILLPLQTGCQTRFIHPNIYAWPTAGSTEKKTYLPVLNWEANKADIVAEKIHQEFQGLRDFYVHRGLNFDSYYNEITDCGAISTITEDKNGKWIVTAPKGVIVCDVLIYAVGFGVEKTELEHTLSYWRCTDISQVPERTAEYLISGVGDGAFMDMISALIPKFDYDKVTSIIAENDLLIQMLTEIRGAFFNALEASKNGGPKLSKTFVFDEFDGLRPRYYEHILPHLNVREFRIVLHGRKPFNEIFDISKVSMLNSFLIFILREKFTYQHGEYSYDKGGRLFALDSGDYSHQGDRVLFRYGSDKDQLLKEIPGLYEKIKNAKLKDLQESNLHDGDIQKLWQDEDFNQRFEQAHYTEIPNVTGNALPCLETFTRGLAGQLRSLLPEGTVFRLTFHKVLDKNKKMYYQQITPYYGHPKIEGDGGFGRIFSWNTGSIGYSILKGQPLLILKKGNKDEYRKLLEHLALTGKTEDLVNSAKYSFLSLPFLAKMANAEPVTNFVLYVDAECDDFFTEPILDSILSASAIFVESFESLVAKNQVNRGRESNPYQYLNDDDKKLFNPMVGFKNVLGNSSDSYQAFVKKVKKPGVGEFMAFNSLT